MIDEKIWEWGGDNIAHPRHHPRIRTIEIMQSFFIPTIDDTGLGWFWEKKCFAIIYESKIKEGLNSTDVKIYVII